jgi:uncharacterized protein (DUF4213/DUF364 family)
MVEALVKHFELKLTDMDETNINTPKFGVTVQSPSKAAEHLDWCDLIVATGSTIVNGTINEFLTGRPVIFYGVTISGAAKLMGWDNFCYCGR